MPAHRAARAGTRALAAGALAATIAGCGNATPRSSARFCGELTAHSTEIRTPPATADEIPNYITLFSKMGEVAPLSVESDWEAIYTSLKTANTVDVADPASMQAVAESAYATQRSAQNVVDWAKQNCSIDIGPVGVVAGGAEVVVPTITSDDAPTPTG